MELREVTHLLTRILHRNDKVNDFFIDWSNFLFFTNDKVESSDYFWSCVRERYCNYGLREGRRKEGAEITC